MEITENQYRCIERAIIRYVKEIPWDEEIHNEQWLTGLQIDNLLIVTENVYMAMYSYEVLRNNK